VPRSRLSGKTWKRQDVTLVPRLVVSHHVVPDCTGRGEARNEEHRRAVALNANGE
jgi:hypothetical protein